ERTGRFAVRQPPHPPRLGWISYGKARVPDGWLDVDGLPEASGRHRRGSARRYARTTTTAATSTVTPRGRPLLPTAARVWRPASPRTSIRRSDAPLITEGWSVKSLVQLTNPVTWAT